MTRQRRSLLASATALGLVLGGGVMSTSGPAGPGEDAHHETTHHAEHNDVGVQMVRFEPGSSRDQMLEAITAAGGEVLTDLSQINRFAVRSDDPAFADALGSTAVVQAVWTDRVVRLTRDDVGSRNSPDRRPLPGNPKSSRFPDPWHDLTSFAGEDAPGVLQWEDDATGNRTAWRRTMGDRTVRVAVIDTGVDGSHKELKASFDKRTSASTIPCYLLVQQYGAVGQKDCSPNDTDGHGTWVASRIAGALNGFGTNGAAPGVQIVGYKVISTTLGYGLTIWVIDAMLRACDSDVDLINMSLGGYDAPGVDDEDYLMWVDAVDYCRAKGVAILAAAGNEHVRVNRVDLEVGGRMLTGVGQVDSGDEGIMTMLPGDTVEMNDVRGTLPAPAGVPGVIMVSAANNTNGTPPPGVLDHLASRPTPGLRDQLAYYSNYGSRVDIAAPGGARKYNVPLYDGGETDILYGGWGQLGALTPNGAICRDPWTASAVTFACFKVDGAGFGWLQGTSMAAPNATGVAALVLSAKRELQGNPDSLLARLQSTARTDMVNQTGPVSATDAGPSALHGDCTNGYCHITFGETAIGFADAYGAGMVNSAAAVAP